MPKDSKAPLLPPRRRDRELWQRLVLPSVFLKHVAKSRPHKRFVLVTEDFRELHWAATPSKLSKGGSKSRQSKSGSKYLKVKRLKRVVVGRRTECFRTSLQKGHDDLCFSLVFERRTLDLQCSSKEDRDRWVSSFSWLIEREKERQSGVSKPFNVRHQTHVNTDFEWSKADIQRDFLLGQLLGKGSFGAVYLGFHKASGMQMAIKLINIDDSGSNNNASSNNNNRGSPIIAQDIRAEVQVLKSCRDEGIVSFYGCAGPDQQGRLWILMELCGGGSLRDLLDTLGPLNETQIQYICLHSLKALLHLHQREIVHRDLKAGNILLTATGKVKITDFGISLSLGGGVNSVGDRKEVIGSPLWMPPEVIAGSGATYLSDVWSLGITLIELAEGVPPFADIESILDILRAIKTQTPPKLSHRAKWSDEFNLLLAKMLRKDPSQRPQPKQLLLQPFVSAAVRAFPPGKESPLVESIRSRLRVKRRAKMRLSQLQNVLQGKGKLSLIKVKKHLEHKKRRNNHNKKRRSVASSSSATSNSSIATNIDAQSRDMMEMSMEAANNSDSMLDFSDSDAADFDYQTLDDVDVQSASLGGSSAVRGGYGATAASNDEYEGMSFKQRYETKLRSAKALRRNDSVTAGPNNPKGGDGGSFWLYAAGLGLVGMYILGPFGTFLVCSAIAGVYYYCGVHNND